MMQCECQSCRPRTCVEVRIGWCWICMRRTKHKLLVGQQPRREYDMKNPRLHSRISISTDVSESLLTYWWYGSSVAARPKSVRSMIVIPNKRRTGLNEYWIDKAICLSMLAVGWNLTKNCRHSEYEPLASQGIDSWYTTCSVKLSWSVGWYLIGEFIG